MRVGDHGFARRDHLVEHQRSFHIQDVPTTSRRSKKLDTSDRLHSSETELGGSVGVRD